MQYFGARITTIFSLMLVLFVIGTMTIGGLITVNFARALREQFVVTIELNQDTDNATGQRMATNIRKMNYVANSSYVSADSALKIMEREIGENPTDFLGYNPLPATIEVQLKAEYATSDSIQPILEKLRLTGTDNIAKVEYNRPLVDLVNLNLKNWAFILGGVALVLLLICIFIISTSVRLSLYAERFKIYTMQMVGASSWYLHTRYTRSSIGLGFIASLLTCGIFAGLIYLAMEYGFRELIEESLLGLPQLAIIAGVIFTLGILIPAIIAWLVVSNYMNRPLEKLYKM